MTHFDDKERILAEMEDAGKVHIECWQCGGAGRMPGCFEDTCSCTGDPDDPDDCCSPRRCDICGGKGGYLVPIDSEAARDAID